MLSELSTPGVSKVNIKQARIPFDSKGVLGRLFRRSTRTPILTKRAYMSLQFSWLFGRNGCCFPMLPTDFEHLRRREGHPFDLSHTVRLRTRLMRVEAMMLPWNFKWHDIASEAAD